MTSLEFQPDNKMMGLDFLMLLQRAIGITPDDLFVYTEKTIPFGPEEPITRGQAMSILADVMTLAGFGADLTAEEESALIKDFSDLEGIDEKLKSDAALLIKLGVFQGKDNKLMAPDDIMTSAEAAATLLRLLKSIQ
ncbi:MAG TPA: S-layer homology domain-containing protein [Clostridiaceae bacterium]|nr:S-layer homology domain-containing protein [Clostridiaceae bacterium]